MDWTLWLLDNLTLLKNFCGNWGVAIIILTILVRLALVPFSVSQQRSMKKMQELSPKLKQIQLTYKSDPQKLQQKMMEFYKEHKFNPLGGCLPLLLQMPVFILLYTALVSVAFLQMAGNSSFLFVHRLDGTLQTYAGPVKDDTFNVKPNDRFITGKYKIEVYLDDGKEVFGQIDDYGKALTQEPKKIVPNKNINFSVSLDKITFPVGAVDKSKIQYAIIPVVNDNSKEIEDLKFEKSDTSGELVSTVKTAAAKTKFNYDVLILIVLFGVTMFISQKMMTSMTPSTAADPQQKAMQESMNKMMPIMILAMFVMVPIPAGVLLYMVVSNIFQVGQTVLINKYLEYEESKTKTVIALPAKIDKPKSSDADNIEDDETGNTNISDKSPITKSNVLGRKKRKGKKFR